MNVMKGLRKAALIGATVVAPSGMFAETNQTIRSNQEALSLITDSVSRYRSALPCLQDSIIINWSQERPSDVSNNAGAQSPTFGVIDFYGDNWRRDVLQNTTVHEMAHACRKQKNILQDPISINPEQNIVAFRGFGLELDDSENPYYGAFEEAAAEAATMYVLGSEYLPRSPQYYALGLVLKHYAYTPDRMQAIQFWHKNSDALSLIGFFTGKSYDEITQRDWAIVLDLFNRAYAIGDEEFNKGLDANTTYANVHRRIYEEILQ